ncbi:tyrosine-type recombinase/integrase [Novosphingobium olei]|uniref:Tyrosine-type recombinase/integrase n=1 Tax=Novosphingobium olei TaxID=2728851 RepID=A0A7Y0BSH6_9SPHN|nr:tyrosine-type recombinase/integrase [Novosphingobium olei]NML95131.1 tyrosine-type recombinase/integrase [Novosphingobium olei]
MPKSRASTAVVRLSTEPADLVGEVRALVGPAVRIDEALLEAAMRGWSANTRRAFRSDLGLWGRWCIARRIAPADAAPADVAAWIRALAGIDDAHVKPRASATIERYLVHLGWAYRMAGLADLTADPLVRFERKAMRKHLGTRQRQAKAIRFKGDIADLDSPATGVCLAHLLKACRRDALGLRDAALLRIAYDTAARRSELVAIDVAHIEGPDREGAGLLHIPSSKADQTGEGALGYLSPATMQAIDRWRAAGAIVRGPLLRRVVTHFDGSIDRIGSERLHSGSIALIYRRLVRQAWEQGLLGAMGEAERDRWLAAVSSHSIRVGVAQDNFVAGEGLPAIMQAYRWKDARTVLRYGSRVSAKSGASARLAKRFSEDS